LLYVLGVNVSIFGTIFCDSPDSDDEAVESSNNNDKHPKEKDVLLVTEEEEKITVTIDKKTVENAIEKGPDLILEGIKDVGPQIGVAAAAGKAAAETVKHTIGMHPLPRAITVGSVAFATAAGTALGIKLGKAATANKETEAEIATPKAADPVSPTEFNSGFIHSVLEDGEIPLIVMVNGLSFLNYIEFSLTLSLFSLLFRKIIIRKLTDLIIKLIQKIKQTNKQKFKEVESIKEKDKDKNVNLNQATDTLEKYTDFLIVFIFICLI
jgi:hypothetical protein